MKSKIVAGLAISLFVLLACTVRFRGQGRPLLPDPPEPPPQESHQPPEVPQSPEPPEPSEDMALKVMPGAGHAWLGVMVSDVTAEQVKDLKLPGEFGVVVEEVRKDSPAAKAGLEKDDVILAFAGERVRSAVQFRRLVRETPVGRTVELEVSRNGQTRTLNVTTESRRDEFGALNFGAFNFEMPKVEIPAIEIPQFDMQMMMHGALLGISGEDLTSQLAQYFGVKQGAGVLVREVMPDSAAQKAGLKAGDVIVRVDQTEVKTVGDLRRALPHDFDKKRKVTLAIVRHRQEQTVGVELEPPAHPLPQRVVECDGGAVSSAELRKLSSDLARQRVELQKAAREAVRQNQQQLQELKRKLELQKQQLQREGKELIREVLPLVTVRGSEVL